MGGFLDKIRDDLNDIGSSLYSDMEAFGFSLYYEARKLASSRVTNELERRVGSRVGTVRDALGLTFRKVPGGIEVGVNLDPSRLGGARRIIFGGRNWRPNDILGAALRRAGLPFEEQ